MPLFRAIGVADVLFADGKADAAETLVRSLLRREGAAGQRTNLLVYLLDQQLQAGHTDAVLRIQEELSQHCSMESPGAVLAALAKCIGLVRDKNPEAAIALMRLSCEILNGDAYPRTNDSPLPAEDAVGFWRGVLAWSQDNTKIEGLEEFVRRQPNWLEADLARVLLARHALDLCQADRATGLLQPVEDSSPVSALAGEQRRRLQALRDRDAALVSTVREQAGLLAEAAEQKGEVRSAVEALLLLAEFGPDVPARMRALSRAAALCGQYDLRQVYGPALRAQLDAVRSQCEDAAALAQCEQLGEQMGRPLTPALQPAERRPGGVPRSAVRRRLRGGDEPDRHGPPDRRAVPPGGRVLPQGLAGGAACPGSGRLPEGGDLDPAIPLGGHGGVGSAARAAGGHLSPWLGGAMGPGLPREPGQLRASRVTRVADRPAGSPRRPRWICRVSGAAADGATGTRHWNRKVAGRRSGR